ncbi:MAG: serine hydrolase, partial [Chitinophagaceae bacterium]
NVLKPMGMASSFYGAPQTPAQLKMVSTAYHMDGSEVPGKYHIYPEQAAAALWTNPSDLAQYIIETQLAWNGRSAKVLDQSTTKLRLTPVMENAALGVFIIKKPDGTYFSHGGANEGFRCQYYGNVDNGNGVVVMVNSDNGAILNEIVNSVAEVYGWKEFYKQTVKKLASVPDDVLNKYAGKYLMEKDTVVISKSGDHLAVQAPNEPMFEIFPESQTLFFIKEIPIQVEFSDGKMFVLNSGRRTEARKL